MAQTPHPPAAAGFPDAFVARVLDDALASGARIYGISGLQGSGKSTIAAQVAALARARGIRTATVSIDDFYLDRGDRTALARSVHPLLATRGPPGTHDPALAVATLDALRDGAPAALPRFDKACDARMPRRDWPHAEDVALTLFEGWFLATPAEDEAALAEPLNALEREEDADGRWRRYCNAALARDYPPLWDRIDRLLFLQPPDFAIVPEWRWQQERALQAAQPSYRAMTRAQLDRFVQHYERVSRQALRTLPALADVVVPLDAQRRPGQAGSGSSGAGRP